MRFLGAFFCNVIWITGYIRLTNGRVGHWKELGRENFWRTFSENVSISSSLQFGMRVPLR